MDRKAWFYGLFLLMGCGNEGSQSPNLDQSPAFGSEEPSGWGHSEGGMPAMGGVDVGRSDPLTHLSYWGSFWKTPTEDNQYTLFDLTVPSQLIISLHNGAGEPMGESMCFYIVGHIDEAAETGYNSYLIVRNFNDLTQYSHIAVYKNSTSVYFCGRDVGGGESNHPWQWFNSQAAAVQDTLDHPAADETLLNSTGCNSDQTYISNGNPVSGHRWADTTALP